MNKANPLPSRERAARPRAVSAAEAIKRDPHFPDVHSAELREKARRDSRAVAASPGEKADQAFIDAISMWDELPPYDAPLPD